MFFCFVTNTCTVIESICTERYLYITYEDGNLSVERSMKMVQRKAPTLIYRDVIIPRHYLIGRVFLVGSSRVCGLNRKGNKIVRKNAQECPKVNILKKHHGIVLYLRPGRVCPMVLKHSPPLFLRCSVPKQGQRVAQRLTPENGEGVTEESEEKRKRLSNRPHGECRVTQSKSRRFNI